MRMADDEKAEASTASTQPAAPTEDGDMLGVLREIRDIQREGAERQARFMWILIPIFALLCVQIVLQLVR